MTPDEAREALRAALDNDAELAARFATADSEDDIRALAETAGIEWADDLTIASENDELADESGDLSDAELESVAGGYTFPRTDWIYCDNPWTNYWCTLRC